MAQGLFKASAWSMAECMMANEQMVTHMGHHMATHGAVVCGPLPAGRHATCSHTFCTGQNIHKPTRTYTYGVNRSGHVQLENKRSVKTTWLHMAWLPPCQGCVHSGMSACRHVSCRALQRHMCSTLSSMCMHAPCSSAATTRWLSLVTDALHASKQGTMEACTQ